MFTPEKLTEEDKIRLEDQLEHFQQKLKIATRKNKPDKLEKYASKIQSVLNQLNGGDSSSESDYVNIPYSEEDDNNVSSVKDFAFHFSLPPEHEVFVSVAVVCLPSSNYEPWQG